MTSYIFDIGGVLLNYDLPQVARLLAGRSPRRIERLLALRTDKSLLEVETGRVNGIEYHRSVIRPIVPESTYRGLVCAWRDVFTVNREGYRLFAGLRKAGCAVYVLSNLGDYNLEALMEKAPFVLENSSGNFFSFRLGCVKPDAAIYLRVCAEIGAKPSDCVFLDDTLECVEGARKVGMTAIQFSSERIAEIRDELRIASCRGSGLKGARAR